MSFGRPPKRLEISSKPGLPVWICGAFRIEPAEGRLLREGHPVALTPKAFELLVVLLSRHGRLVTRQELIARLWPDTFVDEANLTGAVWAVRKALGSGERWIETVPKLGYRFVGPVTEALSPERDTPRAEPRIGSIAVLPLVNLSADPEQEYFVDGMTEALITDLARISALRVISRTTVMRYKGTHLRLTDVAQELSVDGVLEGSVLRVEDRVRVTAQLIDAATDTHIWAERYDRSLTDVLSVHREVARAIAREIQVTLTGDEGLRLSRAHPTRPDAYEAYLRGRFHWRQVTDAGFDKARDCLEQAIALDPLFAEAHSALADVQVALGAFGAERPDAAFAEAEASARRALALDPGLGDAHRVLALARMFHRDWDGAQAAFAAAMAVEPGAAETHSQYSLLLAARGRSEDAVASAEQARRLDPLSPMISNDLAFVLWMARRYQDAIAGYRQTLELEPHFVEARRELGLLHACLGDLDAALPELERAVTLARDVESLTYYGYALASAGREPEARAILVELDAMAKERHVDSFGRAVVCLGLRDHDRALDWLDHSDEERSGSMLWLASWPLFDPLRTDGRFRTLLARVVGG